MVRYNIVTPSSTETTETRQKHKAELASVVSRKEKCKKRNVRKRKAWLMGNWQYRWQYCTVQLALGIGIGVDVPRAVLFCGQNT